MRLIEQVIYTMLVFAIALTVTIVGGCAVIVMSGATIETPADLWGIVMLCSPVLVIVFLVLVAEVRSVNVYGDAR